MTSRRTSTDQQSPVTSTAALIALPAVGLTSAHPGYRHLRFAVTCYGPHDRLQVVITQEVLGAGHHLPHVDLA
ncbi:MAG TPA: hypothetical protein VLL82_07230 [Mycobacterium sp.]|nr:hypothetical protein [Mycobacterium sp.]